MAGLPGPHSDEDHRPFGDALRSCGAPGSWARPPRFLSEIVAPRVRCSPWLPPPPGAKVGAEQADPGHPASGAVRAIWTPQGQLRPYPTGQE